MNSQIRMHDVVALLEDVPTTHFSGGGPLLLRRGQVGTIVMTYDGSAFEVEFASRDGKTYALVPVPSDKLILLYETPQLTAA